MPTPRLWTPILRGPAALAALLAAPLAAAAPPRGLTVDDMLAMQRISSAVASPDGKRIAFVVRDTDLEANRGRTDLWMVDAAGGDARRLTTHPEGDSDPEFSPKGDWVYFLSSRSGSSQVWRIPTSGGEAEPVTKLPLDVNGFRLFPDGATLLVAMDVYPDLAKLEGTVERDGEREKDKVKALAFDELLFRHWDGWEDGKRSHLFVVSTAPNAAPPVDLMAGMDADAPTRPFGGMEETAISPDGKTVAFTARADAKTAAFTNNLDVYLVPAAGGKPAAITADNLAVDTAPVFAPDGKTLAYLTMARPQYESDRTRIALYDLATKRRRVLTEAWDRAPGGITFSADGRTIFTAADHIGNHALFAVDAQSGQARVLVEKGTNSDPIVAGDRIVFARDTLTQPVELFSVAPGGGPPTQLTRLNAERLAKIKFGEYEQFSFKGAKGDTVYGYYVRPVGVAAGVKVPLAFLIHGGPQGSFGDHWHYRWNPEVFAGRGYAVVMIDFHGSTGYGQDFTDAIRGDWGGAPYEDLMLGLDFAIKKYPAIDAQRMVALGASYGGFMINWINGHTDRFKALVCHDGNLDERMAYFDTEELWFPEWDHQGTPWDNPDGFSKHNPIDHVKSWKTPTLVIHGAKDFRVVDTQGMSTFTALRRRGVPARFLWFPDENHWVLKPLNSKRWHAEVFAWIDRYTKK